MKTRFTVLLAIIATWHCCVAPPVSKNNQEEKENEGDGFELMMHYHRYLKEVVGALESDPEFKKKLEAAEESDIRSGKIANELEFVSHHVRTRLDEIKRTELDRLRTLTKQKQLLTDNEVIDDPNHGHLDRANPHTFEIEDLKKLIAKTTEDLAEADRKRREEFKQYELQKEFEKQDKLNHTNGDEKQKLEEQFKEMENKHKKHEPLHEPGHKAQLEEVWEEQDHMQQEFDPKTFFMMHDLDSNGLWDQDEVKALFVKELDKMYAAGAPEDDMRERVEEMERMRETVFHEVDLNRDGFIDFHEFFAQTKKQDFQQDNGWKGLDEQKPYTDEELEAYIRQQQMMHPPPPGYHVPPGHYPPPGAYHPNQVPPGGYQQGYHPNQVPQGYQQPQHPNQVPQGYQQPQHPNQVQQGYPNQIPQGYQQPQHPQAQFQQPQGHHPAQGGNPPLNTNEVYPNQGQQQQQPGQVNQVPVNQQNFQPNQAQVNPGQPIQQGQANQQPLTGGHQPQAGVQGQQNYQPNSGQQNYQTNQVPQQPNYQVNQGLPNQAQPNQVNAGQPNQVNQGQPGQVNAGQPNQVNAGQPGQVNQGQPGQVNPGQPGLVNPGQPGQVNQGQPVHQNEPNQVQGQQKL